MEVAASLPGEVSVPRPHRRLGQQQHLTPAIVCPFSDDGWMPQPCASSDLPTPTTPHTRTCSWLDAASVCALTPQGLGRRPSLLSA